MVREKLAQSQKGQTILNSTEEGRMALQAMKKEKMMVKQAETQRTRRRSSLVRERLNNQNVTHEM